MYICRSNRHYTPGFTFIWNSFLRFTHRELSGGVLSWLASLELRTKFQLSLKLLKPHLNTWISYFLQFGARLQNSLTAQGLSSVNKGCSILKQSYDQSKQVNSTMNYSSLDWRLIGQLSTGMSAPGGLVHEYPNIILTHHLAPHRCSKTMSHSLVCGTRRADQQGSCDSPLL